eukprot:1157016-Pelagomonas_calceolata.AAC.7
MMFIKQVVTCILTLCKELQKALLTQLPLNLLMWGFICMLQGHPATVMCVLEFTGSSTAPWVQNRANRCANT